jgi:hypothetical protein
MTLGNDSANDTVRVGKRRERSAGRKGEVSRPSKRLPLLTKPP